MWADGLVDKSQHDQARVVDWKHVLAVLAKVDSGKIVDVRGWHSKSAADERMLDTASASVERF